MNDTLSAGDSLDDAPSVPDVYHIVTGMFEYNGAAQQALLVARKSSSTRAIVNLERLPQCREGPHGIKILSCSMRIIPQVLFWLRFFLLEDVQLLHFHGIKPIPIVLAVLLRWPFILKTSIDGVDDLQSVSKKRLGSLKVFILKQCAANIVLSEFSRRHNIPFLGEDRVYLVPNGVELPETVHRNKGNIFCFAGLICPRKRTLVSIQYFHKFFAGLPGARLVIAGPYGASAASIEYSEAYYLECRAYVRNNNLEDIVEFRGLLDQEDLRTLFSDAKALLFFSEREGMPNVVLEAMAFNCVPVVGEINGSARDIVPSGAGFVLSDLEDKVEVEDIDGLISEAGPRKHCEKSFSIEGTVDQLENVYRIVAKETGLGRRA
jgi:glycosyltransferase involved in cell wall biosynthesis